MYDNIIFLIPPCIQVRHKITKSALAFGMAHLTASHDAQQVSRKNRSLSVACDLKIHLNSILVLGNYYAFPYFQKRKHM